MQNKEFDLDSLIYNMKEVQNHNTNIPILPWSDPTFQGRRIAPILIHNMDLFLCPLFSDADELVNTCKGWLPFQSVYDNHIPNVTFTEKYTPISVFPRLVMIFVLICMYFEKLSGKHFAENCFFFFWNEHASWLSDLIKVITN